LNGAVSKTVRGLWVPRGFESHPLRLRSPGFGLVEPNPAARFHANPGRSDQRPTRCALARKAKLRGRVACGGMAAGGRRETSRPSAPEALRLEPLLR
jgi:hypothetical protein